MTDEAPSSALEARHAELPAAWVSEPPPLDGRITLSEYDPDWPALFRREEARVRATLGATAVLVEHTGSTSVPGLAAKPIIDMLLLVPDSADEPTYVPQLEAAGYRLVIREPEWHQHRVFKGPDTNVNLHVLTVGSDEAERILAFRDWLRTHDEDRELYERTKRSLAEREWEYVQDYADAKGEVVESIIARARGSKAG